MKHQRLTSIATASWSFLESIWDIKLADNSFIASVTVQKGLVAFRV